MRIRVSKERGSVLVILLVTAILLLFSLGIYLNLVRNQNLATMRSLAWNTAIPVLEAGIEEALSHLFYNSTNLPINGWIPVSGGYQKERFLKENKFVVTIYPGAKYSVVSRAYVRQPLGTNFLEPPRAVRVTLTNTPTFAKGMVAKGNIDLSGNMIKTDSFDSSDPSYSTNGRYDENKIKDNGDVATNSSVIDTLNVWNAEIYGRALTGPGGNVRLQNGAVGSLAWHSGNNTGIQPGWSNDDMNVFFPDVSAPFAGGAFAPTSGWVNGVYYKYILGSGNYKIEDINLSGDEKVLVAGKATLLVTDELNISGQGGINITTNGGLQLFMAGEKASFTGQGVGNQTGNATNLYYYGMPSNKQISLTGNAAFVGAIYAPQAALVVGGGGTDEYELIGASVSASVKMNGKVQFHYDENLGKVGPRRGYTVESWNEVLPTSNFLWEEM